jgi:hypothetical protein
VFDLGYFLQQLVHFVLWYANDLTRTFHRSIDCAAEDEAAYAFHMTELDAVDESIAHVLAALIDLKLDTTLVSIVLLLGPIGYFRLGHSPLLRTL